MIGTLIMGAIVGWIAGKLMNLEGGLLRNLIVGIIGSFVGGIVFRFVGLSAHASLAICWWALWAPACLSGWAGRSSTETQKAPSASV